MRYDLSEVVNNSISEWEYYFEEDTPEEETDTPDKTVPKPDHLINGVI